MMKPSPILLLLIFALSCKVSLMAQDWDFVKEKDGVRMFTRAEEGSPFKCFRGETVFNAGMEEVSRYIGVANNFDQWDENIRELSVIESIPGQVTRSYFVYRTPWPLSNRDFCVEVRINYDSATQTKTVLAQPMDSCIAERKGIIRIKNYWMKWTLTKTSGQTILGTLEGFVDPGGLVPFWLYNLVIVEAPHKVIRGIKQKVEQPSR